MSRIEDLETLLVAIAKSGVVPPLHFIIAARQIPGYDPGKAHRIENQYFDNDGFPITDEEGEAIDLP